MKAFNKTLAYNIYTTNIVHLIKITKIALLCVVVNIQAKQLNLFYCMIHYFSF